MAKAKPGDEKNPKHKDIPPEPVEVTDDDVLDLTEEEPVEVVSTGDSGAVEVELAASEDDEALEVTDAYDSGVNLAGTGEAPAEGVPPAVPASGDSSVAWSELLGSDPDLHSGAGSDIDLAADVEEVTEAAEGSGSALDLAGLGASGHPSGPSGSRLDLSESAPPSEPASGSSVPDIDFGAVEDETLHIGSDSNIPRASEEGLSGLDLGELPPPAEPLTGPGSVVHGLNLSDAEDETLLVEEEVVEEAVAEVAPGSSVDLGESLPRGKQPLISDLNLVSDAMESGAGKLAMGGPDSIEQLGGELTETGEEQRPDSEEELDLGAAPPAPDIAAQVESGADLLNAGQEAIEEEIVEEEIIEEAASSDDSSVDLGSQPEIPEEEIAAPVSSGLDLTKNEPAGDDLENAMLEETRQIDAAEEPVEEAAEEGSEVEQTITEGDGVISEEAAEEEAEEEAEEKPRGAREPKAPAKKGGGMLVGTALGLVLGAGTVYALLLFNVLSGLIPPEYLPSVGASRPQPPPRQQGGGNGPPQDANQAYAHLQDGEFDKAVKILEQIPDTGDPKQLAARGEALWLRAVQKVVNGNTEPAKWAEELKKDPDVTKAKDDLGKAASPDAMYWLGEIDEMLESPDKARARYQEGVTKFGMDPAQKQRFEAALQRLDLQAATKPMGGAMLLPAEGRGLSWLVLAMVMQAGIPDDPKPVPQGAPEAGFEFWKALKLAGERKFSKFGDGPDGAIETLEKARQLHDKGRFVRLRKAQNPMSDPKEEIFLRACDELILRWKIENASLAAQEALKKDGYDALAEELAKQKNAGETVKFLAATVSKIAGEMKNAKVIDDPKTVKVEDLVNGAKAVAAEREKVDAVVKELIDAKVEKFKELKDPAEFKGTKDDLAKGVKDLQGFTTAEREKVDAVVKELIDAKIEKFKDLKDPSEFKGTKDDLAKGVKVLVAEKVKVDAVVQELTDAKVDPKELEKGPAAGVKALAGDRDTTKAALGVANGILEGIVKDLVEGKHLPKDAKRDDAAKGVKNLIVTADHPVVKALSQVGADLGTMSGRAGDQLMKELDVRARLAAVATDNLRLQGELSQRWKPEQLLPVWRQLLARGTSKDNLDKAVEDVRRVINAKPSPEAVLEAVCVQGLADRDVGKFADARKAMAVVKDAKVTNPEKVPAWKTTAEAVYKELTDPRTFYIPAIREAQAAKDYDLALKLTNEALTVFDKEGFAKGNAALMALRSVLRLEQLKATAKDKLDADLVKDSLADAATAIKDGEEIEGNYAAAKVLQATGDLGKAEAGFRAAVEAHKKADAKSFMDDHPACDPTGNRYMKALGDVLLEEVRTGVAAPPAPKEDPKAEKTTDRRFRDDAEFVSAVYRKDRPAEVVTVAERKEFVYTAPPMMVWIYGCPGVYSVPVLMLDPAAVADVEGKEKPANPKLDEIITLADKMIADFKSKKDPKGWEGYLLKGQALAEKGQWTEGLMNYVEGMKHADPERAKGMTFLIENHPAFKRPDPIKPPDPLQAEGFYARGMRYYFERRYDEAEKEFLEAYRYNDQDARYQYFLGLSRLNQKGKRDLALEDFRQAARLEQQEKPAPAAVSVALEKIQGPQRRILNEIRDRAMRDALSKD